MCTSHTVVCIGTGESDTRLSTRVQCLMMAETKITMKLLRNQFTAYYFARMNTRHGPRNRFCIYYFERSYRIESTYTVPPPPRASCRRAASSWPRTHGRTKTESRRMCGLGHASDFLCAGKYKPERINAEHCRWYSIISVACSSC